ncbi:hypothetical protein B0H17DRAFT_143101 [Mycena rosella]|uniref:Cytochrome b561 domain-containing protein n=1 Tax=Mycena rosella TaxID=1033263 RepID=A0AAD7DZC3_MYCRO|nr:hypothetical protein B0H17DRAFT_143101 [Mycena rosella]
MARPRSRTRTPAMASDPNAEDYELLLPAEQSGELSKARGQEDQLASEGRKGDTVAMYLALSGAALFMTITWVIVLVNSPLNWGWFAFHPLLQSLAMFLFTYGILTLQPTSQPKTKAAGLARHQYAILLAGFPAIFLGTSAVWYNKFAEGASHFKSWHGKLGIISLGWICIQVLLGGGSVWFGGAAFGGGSKAKAIWKYHRLSGYVLFGLLTFTSHLGGGWSNWGNKYSPLSMRIVAYWIALVACISGLYMRLRPSKMKFY